MGTPLSITETAIAGVLLLQFSRSRDERGSFSRWFCLTSLQAALHGKQIRQINHSVNLHKGVVRGLHYMPPSMAEFKLVRCISGAVFDVVVDLRANSATVAQHINVELSAENDVMLLIPPGCAHGFQALQDNSQLLYLHTADYAPQHDSGFRLDSPALNIQWPLPITALSARDQNLPLLKSDFNGIAL